MPEVEPLSVDIGQEIFKRCGSGARGGSTKEGGYPFWKKLIDNERKGECPMDSRHGEMKGNLPQERNSTIDSDNIMGTMPVGKLIL